MHLAKTSKATWALLLAALIATPAVADDQSDEMDDETPDETEAPLLDRVQVTARRREESLQAVPISVTALSGQALDDVGAQDITYLKQAVPNTTIEVARGTSNTLTAFIRGIGQQDPVAGFESGVGIYLDDIYLNRPQGAVLDIYDVERIEVLRGPQGTLYGRNTIGGAVKYVTRRLGDEPALQVSGSLGSYSHSRSYRGIYSSRTVWTNRSIFSRSLTPGADSTPDDTSTASGLSRRQA